MRWSHKIRILSGFATVAVALALVSAGSPGAGGPSASVAAKGKGPRIKVMRTDYGPILVNGKGRALYLFTADGGKQSNCYDACAAAWPPYVVKSRPSAAGGAKQGLIGTTRRSDGRLQATYAGHPVYFYVGDDEPGEVLCQAADEFGGLWYVVRANGKVVT